MRAVNLYSISRDMNREIKPQFEQALSDRESPMRVREDELKQVRNLSDAFDREGAELYCYEDWFYSFSIPQIGKEFDLIKIGEDNTIINVELKSQEVTRERIKKQLKQNRHYFSHIASRIYSFTFMNCEDGARIYRYEHGDLRLSDFHELTEVVKTVKVARHDGIENIFRPRDYLISPLNSPEKYLEGRYYLTNLQEIIKEKILNSFASEHALWGINGAAGTGKTLLLYDLVRKLSRNKRICIVHCGALNDGHRYISDHLDNVTIVPAEEVTCEMIEASEIVCVDETQRLDAECLAKVILKAYREGRIQGCIFSYDEYQTLSAEEERNDIRSLLLGSEGYREEHLTDRIRTNREVNWFIKNMLSLRDHAPSFFDFDNIDVLYANDDTEAERLIKFYQEKEYVFIDYMPVKEGGDGAAVLNSYTVIGQEFDNVIMCIDDKFSYNERGDLTASECECPEYRYLKMFYQNVTRTREKLCIVVKDNQPVFEALISILSQN